MTDVLEMRIREALTLSVISVRLGLFAVGCFCVFGTLASLDSLRGSTLVYWAFHYLPYALIALTIPISLYHSFVFWRYRVIQLGILQMMLAVGFGLLFAALMMHVQDRQIGYHMSVFLAMIAWFGMPFLFRVNLQKFLNFLQDKTSSHET